MRERRDIGQGMEERKKKKKSDHDRIKMPEWPSGSKTRKVRILVPVRKRSMAAMIEKKLLKALPEEKK